MIWEWKGEIVKDREQITIRLPVELIVWLQQEANNKGISFNAYILMLLNEEQTHHQKE